MPFARWQANTTSSLSTSTPTGSTPPRARFCRRRWPGGTTWWRSSANSALRWSQPPTPTTSRPRTPCVRRSAATSSPWSPRPTRSVTTSINSSVRMPGRARRRPARRPPTRQKRSTPRSSPSQPTPRCWWTPTAERVSIPSTSCWSTNSRKRPASSRRPSRPSPTRPASRAVSPTSPVVVSTRPPPTRGRRQRTVGARDLAGVLRGRMAGDSARIAGQR